MGLIPQSMRWRMLLWQASLLFVLLAGFGATAYQLDRMNRLRAVDEDLERRLSALMAEVRGRPPFGPGMPGFQPGLPPPAIGEPDGPGWGEGPPPRRRGPEPGRSRGRGPEGFFENLERREIRLSAGTAALFAQEEAGGCYFAVWSRSGRALKVSTNAPAVLDKPGRAGAGPGLQWQGRQEWREAVLQTEMGECVLVGRSIRPELEGLRRFAWRLVAAGLAVLGLGLGGGWFVASRALRSIDAISAAASRIAEGRLSERINTQGIDSELGRLAGVLNATFARLETAFSRQKQFTADASHELRTPIAVLISETQTALARPRDAAEYRETVEACLDTAQQMRKLTDSLLNLARLDGAGEPGERTPVDLAAVAAELVERVRPLAMERGVQMTCDLQPAQVMGDAVRLGQVAANLLTNAIYHNKENGQARVTVRCEPAGVVLEVSDNGPGIPPADLPRIFDRFYRADKARARAGGRHGLGLAICRAIVEAHGGRVEAASRPGQGAVFTVRLPACQGPGA